MPDTNVWRIKLGLKVPLDVQIGGTEAINTTRIPARMTQVIDNVVITYGPWFGSPVQLQGIRQPSQVAALTVTRRASTAQEALDQSIQLLESIIDDLSFQFQENTSVEFLEVLDVTPPLVVGESRDGLWFPSPSKVPLPRLLDLQPLGSTTTYMVPTIRPNYTITSEKTRAALRWYAKGLAATSNVDQFMCYWIAVELLCMESKLVIKNPYKAPCGHVIPQCPTCKKSTEKMVNGDTIKQYMVGTLGIKAGDASDLWRVRQIFHGQNRLDQNAVRNLPGMVYLIRYAAFQALKMGLGIDKDQPPLFELGMAQVGDISFGMNRPLVEADLVIDETSEQVLLA